MLFTKGREWKLSCSLDNLWIPCGIFGVYLLPILPSDRIREVWKQQLDNEKNKVGLTLSSFEVTNNHLAGLSCGLVHYAVQGGSNFRVCGWILKGNRYSNESYWAVLYCSSVYCAEQGGSNFWVWGWNPTCDHLTERHLAVLSRGSIYCAVW